MRGLVKFEAAGQEYALRFTNNRLCQLEEDSGESVMVLAARLEDPDRINMTDVRMMFRAGLDGDFTLDAAGDLIDLIGVRTAVEIVAKAFASTFQLTVVEGGKPGGKPKAGTV